MDSQYRSTPDESPGDPYPSAPPLGDTTLFSYIELLRRRWWLLLLPPLVGAAAGYWIEQNRGAADRYTASAMVQTEEAQMPIEGLLPGRAGEDASTSIASQVEVMQSRVVVGGVVDSLGVFRRAAAPGGEGPALLTRDEAIRRLTGELDVRHVSGTNLIRIRYTSDDPVLAATTTNLLAALYQRHSALSARDAATRRRELIQGQLLEVADSLDAARQALTAYQQSSGVLDPGEQGQVVAASLAEAERELRELRFQEARLQGVLGSVRSAKPEEALHQVAVHRDVIPGGAELYARLQQLGTERSRLTASRYGYREGGPGVDVVDSLIADTRADLRATIEQSLVVLGQRRAAAEARAGELQARMSTIPGRTSSQAELQERVVRLQSVHDRLTEHFREAQVAEEVESGSARLVDPATVPTRPDPARRGRVVLLALMVGLVLGTGGTWLIERLDTSIRGGEEASRLTGLEVIASIPEFSRSRKEKGGRAVLSEMETCPEGQAFHMLRTALHFLRAERTRVLGITSALPEEGKSTVAANLAAAMAEHGMRVLLVDADLHRSVQHEIFGEERAPGLSDVLVGDLVPARAIRKPREGLDLLTAGSRVPGPSRLMEGEEFARFLEGARTRYDAIVLDMPPVLAVADAGAMAGAFDGVVTVLRFSHTSRFSLLRAVERLRQLQRPQLGLVVNRVPVGRGGGRYSGYYGYYGHTYDATSYYGEEKPRSGGLLRLLRGARGARGLPSPGSRG